MLHSSEKLKKGKDGDTVKRCQKAFWHLFTVSQEKVTNLGRILA